MNAIVEGLLKFEYFWQWLFYRTLASITSRRFPAISHGAESAALGAWLVLTDPQFPSPDTRAEMGTTVTVFYLIALGIALTVVLRGLYL